MAQQTGWLSPMGDMYPCSYHDHVAEAEKICDILNISTETTHYDDELLKRGWAKMGISLLGVKRFYIRWEKRLTQYQRYALREIFEAPKPDDISLDALTLSMWKYEEDFFEGDKYRYAT